MTIKFYFVSTRFEQEEEEKVLFSGKSKESFEAFLDEREKNTVLDKKQCVQVRDSKREG